MEAPAPALRVRGFFVPVGMPTRPTTFRPARGAGSEDEARARRREYDRRRLDESQTRRLYKTPRWQALRGEQLRIEPLCRMCLAEGRVTPAVVCDHVEPHRGNVDAFWGGPFQSLCTPCHDGPKRAAEMAAARGK